MNGMDIFEWFMENAMPWVAVLFLAALVLSIPIIGYALWEDAHRPTFDLRKDAWHCTLSHRESSTIYIKSGNVLIPSTTNSTVCDQWTSNP